MKKLVGLLLAGLIIYSIYYDMTVGTLPNAAVQTAVTVTETNVKPESNVPYFEASVEPGDTLVTVVEHKMRKPLPVSMGKLIRDFQTLNPGQAADKIQVGKTYRFPFYKD
jgi:hypothetical protein